MYVNQILCAGVTKGTFLGILISKKMRFYKAVQNFLKIFFYVKLLMNIVYFVYIDLSIHIKKFYINAEMT